MLNVLLFAIFTLAAAPVLEAAAPKATAPVVLEAVCLDPVRVSTPFRIRLTATPTTDAALLRLRWLLPEGVLAEGGPVAWSGAAKAGIPVALTLSIRLPDLAPRRLIGGATFENPDGSRQVKAATLDLPPGVAAKTQSLPPVTFNSHGQPIVEHLVAPR